LKVYKHTRFSSLDVNEKSEENLMCEKKNAKIHKDALKKNRTRTEREQTEQTRRQKKERKKKVVTTCSNKIK